MSYHSIAFNRDRNSAYTDELDQTFNPVDVYRCPTVDPEETDYEELQYS